ncbi:MAG: hypothetical protein JZU55_14290 [Afipia sp.]|jgi:hypothetical protein|nr:hypothetical protein [Afipia sp.]
MAVQTTPRLFYDFFVRPNFDDFLAHPDDIRLGFNASVSAFQQADIFYAFYRRHDAKQIAPWPTKKSLLIHLATIEPSFRTIQSVATVYKHLYATAGFYETGSPMALWGVSSPKENAALRIWGQSQVAEVIVHRKDKTQVLLSFALRAVVNELWPKFLPDEAWE